MVKVKEQLEILQKGAKEIIPLAALEQKLLKSATKKEPLKVKFGLDPTAKDLHIGHTVVFKKLRQFQELGHIIQLVIGDFTACIGDPTGKVKTRKQLSYEEVKENAKTYTDQLFKILKKDSVTIYYNSSWLNKMSFLDVINLSSKSTVARMLEREDFAKRFDEGSSISLHEFLYPLIQGYDSVVLKSDIEIGGTDQKFNLLMGRQLQKDFGQEEQVVILMPLLEGLDGLKKMSKSLGNYISLTDDPKQMYGKAMSLPDNLMLKYFSLVTDITDEELASLKKSLEAGKLNPRDAKMKLSYMLVAKYHNEDEALKAEEYFKEAFQQRVIPKDIATVSLSKEEVLGKWLVSFLVQLGLVETNSQARRMIEQGAVRINGKKISDVDFRLPVEIETKELVLQVGKRRFKKILIH